MVQLGLVRLHMSWTSWVGLYLPVLVLLLVIPTTAKLQLHREDWLVLQLKAAMAAAIATLLLLLSLLRQLSRGNQLC
jgi:hypothetical protein